MMRRPGNEGRSAGQLLLASRKPEATVVATGRLWPQAAQAGRRSTQQVRAFILGYGLLAASSSHVWQPTVAVHLLSCRRRRGGQQPSWPSAAVRGEPVSGQGAALKASSGPAMPQKPQLDNRETLLLTAQMPHVWHWMGMLGSLNLQRGQGWLAPVSHSSDGNSLPAIRWPLPPSSSAEAKSPALTGSVHTGRVT